MCNVGQNARVVISTGVLSTPALRVCTKRRRGDSLVLHKEIDVVQPLKLFIVRNFDHRFELLVLINPNHSPF